MMGKIFSEIAQGTCALSVDGFLLGFSKFEDNYKCLQFPSLN